VQHILNMKQELLTIANSKNPTLINLGGGAKDLSVDILPVDPGRRGAVEAPENNESSPTTHCPLPTAQIIRIHLYVDCKDAMGANIVNTMVEAIAPKLEKLGGKAVLKIVSNLADRRLARAECVFKKELLSEQTINLIIKANQVAEVDPYRAATHNKGIMNAISAICIATGNDWRAVEAGAHAYASVSGGAGAPGRRGGEVHTLHSTIHTPSYKPLTHYELTGNNDLKASIELPLAVATVGGSTKHPQAQVNLKILGVKSAQELAQVMAAAGLAQNFAALKAITTEGIQKGHMKLHERKK
jgi:hydroxymethylglutaryl-CoA reductase